MTSSQANATQQQADEEQEQEILLTTNANDDQEGEDKLRQPTFQQYIMRTVRAATSPRRTYLTATLPSSIKAIQAVKLVTSRSHHSSSNTKRVWIVTLVAGLLMVEFTLQKLYYNHLQQQANHNDLEAIVVPKSQAFLNQLNLETCKFPLFFDKSRFDWHLQDNAFVSIGNWRQRNQQYVGAEDARNVYNQIKIVQKQRYEARQKAREQHQPTPRLVRRNITFVHIGKAGGSTVACNLRAGRRYIQEHCDNIDYDEIDADASYDPAEHNGQPYIPESAISRHVNCYTHWRMHLKCFYLQGDHPFQGMNTTGVDHNFGSRALSSRGSSSSHHHHSSSSSHHHSSSSSSSSSSEVSTRADREEPYRGNDYSKISKQLKVPIQPASEPAAYPGNDYLVNLRSPVDRIASWFVYEHAENHDFVYSDRPYHCGQLVLSSCYQHFEHLTTVGLSFPRPSINQPLKVGTNLTAVECSHWAWATVQGNMPADYHNAFNYDWYAYRLLHDSANQNADVFVLRVEHLEQDWTTVDTMLGGDGSFPATMATRQNSASIKPLRIANHNTTDVGIQNLCRALCDEIQVYKQLLVRAINLGPDDLEASMEELRQQCPDERDILPRQCHYD